MIKRIALRKFLVSKREDSPSPQTEISSEIQELLVKAIENSDFSLALIEWVKPQLSDNFREKLKNLFTKAASFRAVLEMIEQKKPFKLFYQDAAGTDFIFSVAYAQMSNFEGKEYLECWCEETDGNRDLPELQHNWSFRPDRISHAGIVPWEVPWRSQGLDYINAEILLFDGLAHGYSPLPGDKAEWIDSNPPTKRIIRPITSSFWFIRRILTYGAKCEVIGNKNLRDRIIQEILVMSENYDSKNPN
jgi:hypothetical protein